MKTNLQQKSMITTILVFLIIINNMVYAQQWLGATGVTGSVNSFTSEGLQLYAGGVSVAVSQDGGVNWKDYLSSQGNVSSMTTCGTSVFAVSSSVGVYISNDSSKTWSPVNSGLTNTSVYCLATLGNNIFAGTLGGGVFISGNLGAAWNSSSNGITNQNIYSMFVFGSDIYVGTTGGGIFRSTDNGGNWFSCNSGLINLHVIAIGGAGSNLFVGTKGAGVFTSTDNGGNWTQVNNGLTNLGVTSFTSKGNDIYLGTAGAGVFKSTDMGANWIDVNFNLSASLPYSVYRLFTYGNNILMGGGLSSVWYLDLTTSLYQENKNYNLCVYPTLVQKEFTIENPNPETKQNLFVYNEIGQCVFSSIIFDKQKENINCSNLPKGVYFVKLISDKTNFVAKIIKQ